MAFFWARCTDMALISSCEAACRSESPSRMVSLRAVACVCRQLIEQARLASGVAIKADMTQWALTLLMQPPWNAHQPHPIAQVVLQGPGDAATQIGLSWLAGSAAGNRAHQGLAGHLEQTLPLHQREQAPGGG